MLAAILICGTSVFTSCTDNDDNPVQQNEVGVKTMEQPATQSAVRRALTRAGGSSAINEMMDASETFTYSGAIDWRNSKNATSHYTNRVLTTVRSWGIHNMESNIRNAFPDLYANVFTIADKTSTSLNTIGYIVNYTKQIFTQNIDILQSYAKSWGIRKYTIHWRCDDMNVTTHEGYTVTTLEDSTE